MSPPPETGVQIKIQIHIGEQSRAVRERINLCHLSSFVQAMQRLVGRVRQIVSSTGGSMKLALLEKWVKGLGRPPRTPWRWLPFWLGAWTWPRRKEKRD
jgi:hypothetical protein